MVVHLLAALVWIRCGCSSASTSTPIQHSRDAAVPPVSPTDSVVVGDGLLGEGAVVDGDCVGVAAGVHPARTASATAPTTAPTRRPFQPTRASFRSTSYRQMTEASVAKTFERDVRISPLRGCPVGGAVVAPAAITASDSPFEMRHRGESCLPEGGRESFQRKQIWGHVNPSS